MSNLRIASGDIHCKIVNAKNNELQASIPILTLDRWLRVLRYILSKQNLSHRHQPYNLYQIPIEIQYVVDKGKRLNKLQSPTTGQPPWQTPVSLLTKHQLHLKFIFRNK